MFVIRWPLAVLRHLATSRRWRVAFVATAAAALALRARSVTSAAPNRLRAIAQEIGADLRVMFGRDQPGAQQAPASSSPSPSQAAAPAGGTAATPAGPHGAATAGAPASAAGAEAPAASRGSEQATADNATNIPGNQPGVAVAAPTETIDAGEDRTGTFRPTRAETDEFGVVVTDDAPAGLKAGDWVKGDGSPNCPEDHPIKGNANSRIYHLPGEPSYNQTIPELCFATEEDAAAAGYRPRSK